MRQMQHRAALGDHVGGPIPTPRRLHRHLSRGTARSDDLGGKVCWRVVYPTPRHPITVLVQHDDHRPAPVQVDPYVRSHLEPPSLEGWCKQPQASSGAEDRTSARRLNPPTNSTWDQICASHWEWRLEEPPLSTLVSTAVYWRRSTPSVWNRILA